MSEGVKVIIYTTYNASICSSFNYNNIRSVHIYDSSLVGWKLYPERKGGVKTNDILEFYNEFIHSKYKDYLVIMDNAVIHKSKIIRETIENDNNHLIYSVPYHPETNSIEEFFSRLSSALAFFRHHL